MPNSPLLFDYDEPEYTYEDKLEDLYTLQEFLNDRYDEINPKKYLVQEWFTEKKEYELNNIRIDIDDYEYDTDETDEEYDLVDEDCEYIENGTVNGYDSDGKIYDIANMVFMGFCIDSIVYPISFYNSKNWITITFESGYIRIIY